MKISMKKTVIASVVLTSLVLTACSGGNPLETQPKADARLFLEEASKVAEKQLKIKSYPPGDTYHACMTGGGMVDKRQNPHVCEDLYDAMIVYAKTTDGPFKHITLTELQDQKAFRPLYNIPFDHYYN